MPVTIKPTSHNASDARGTEFAQDTHDLLKTACAPCTNESQGCEKIIQSSFPDANLKDSHILASANGFVHAAIKAYSMSHHLTIRPEDVWFAILSQLSIWITANAEEAGVKFFAHERKKDVTVTVQEGGDYRKFAEDMTREIEKNIADPELREWIMPTFTTTIATDTVVASVLIMGTMQKPFRHLTPSRSYLPSVTLLGEQSDWETLKKKLYKLATFGDEPARFAILLTPIILRFIESFHDPTSEIVINFWSHFVTAGFQGTGGGDSIEYEGWISAFLFWNAQGKMNDDRAIQLRESRDFSYGGESYQIITPYQIPSGCASLPVKVDDDGNELDAVVIAGSVGMQYTSSDGASAGSAVGLDTVSPVSGCWIFVKKTGIGEVATSGGMVQGLINRLANLFSLTDISK